MYRGWLPTELALMMAPKVELFKIRMMVIFGAVNLVILLTVDAIKTYAFTSVWCAYAAVASVIILVYFWRSMEERPFRYAHAL